MKKRLLWVSDGYVPTGFGRVAHSILRRIHGHFDVKHIAINYHGQEHDLPWELIPASQKGDIWGVGVLKEILKEEKFDFIILFNDLYVIDYYLKVIDEIWEGKRKSKIIVYFPIDSMYPGVEHFLLFKKYVDVIFTYTNWAVEQIKQSAGELIEGIPVKVIRHGIDRDTFFKVNKRDAIEALFSTQPPKVKRSIRKSVVFLNANRNQPRKRIDLTIAGFSYFVKKLGLTPDDVRLYLHMGMMDAGWNIPKLVQMYDITDYVLFTHLKRHHPMVSDEMLNYVYNVADVNVNTSEGEGFGLIPVETAILGKPQVLAKNSVVPELFGDDAYLIDCPIMTWSIPFTTVFYAATPFTVAEQMERAYIDVLRKKPKLAGHRFNSIEYDWDYIAGQFLDELQ